MYFCQNKLTLNPGLPVSEENLESKIKLITLQARYMHPACLTGFSELERIGTVSPQYSSIRLLGILVGNPLFGEKMSLPFTKK